MNVFQGLKLPEIIYETSSKYNESIQVVKLGDLLRLRVNGTDQSLNHTSQACKRLVWGQAIDLLKREQPKIQKILVFGLGGGTMQHLISEAYPQAQIVSVEIDPVMVDIAKQYFDVDSIKNHKIIVEDAFRVVIEPKEHDIEDYEFDAVLVDIYQGDRFPELGNSGNFFAALKKLVKPGGLVIINRIYKEEHQIDVDNFINYVEMVLKDVNSEVVAGHTNSDNVLIFGRT